MKKRLSILVLALCVVALLAPGVASAGKLNPAVGWPKGASLSVTANGDGSYGVAWPASLSPVAYYRVDIEQYVDRNPYFYGSSGNLGSTTLSYTTGQLAPGTYHIWLMVQLDGEGYLRWTGLEKTIRVR